MNKLLTTKEAAALLNLSPDSIGVYIRQGILSATKYGRDWLIDRQEVERYQHDRRVRGGGAILRAVPDLYFEDTLAIPLSNGQGTIVDAIDRDLYAHKWQCSNGYASRPINRRSVSMHRIIMERVIGRTLRSGEYVDHIDRDPLNNRRSNLRLSTPTQNLVNSNVNRRSRTGYKGVQYKSDLGRYRARIGNQHLGYFDTAIDAARAYNRAAVELYGEFAKLNDVSE